MNIARKHARINDFDLPPLIVPPDINYVGVFLTFRCNLDCSYCINDPDQLGARSALGRGEMTPDQWGAGLRRLGLAEDLPISLQGGEPVLYGRGQGLRHILAQVDVQFDLLTNLPLPPERMRYCRGGHTERLRRAAPYPSVRVSHHPLEMDHAWGRGIHVLVERCEALGDLGFAVTTDKQTSDVGIYMVTHPDNMAACEEVARVTEGRVVFETKEFLGLHAGKLFGNYRYPFSTDLVAGGHWKTTLRCECQTTELLIDPLGFVWPCHYYLYECWQRTMPQPVFDWLSRRGFAFSPEAVQDLSLKPLGHILDPEFDPAVLRRFRRCDHYGRCIGCDTKVKNNRFQALDDKGEAHTSVEIRHIEFPSALRTKVAQIAEGRPTGSI